MWFSDSIPEEVLNSPRTFSFLKVLDKLQEFKQETLTNSLRVNNPVLCNDKKWLIRNLADFGIFDVPEVLPVVCLQQVLLNAEVLHRLRGTLEGLTLLCESFFLGTATFDTSDFLKDFVFLMPDSVYDTYITDTNDIDTFRYLVDRNNLNEARSLTITINSKVFVGKSSEQLSEIRNFLISAIDGYLGFHPNCTITVTLGTLTDYVYPEIFNDYFKNT